MQFISAKNAGLPPKIKYAEYAKCQNKLVFSIEHQLFLKASIVNKKKIIGNELTWVETNANGKHAAEKQKRRKNNYIHVNVVNLCTASSKNSCFTTS